MTVIVLNYNGNQFIRACLDSLCSQSHKDLEILVVDNGSTDGSFEFVSENYPQVVAIRNEKNLGFAEGNNIGIRDALSRGADYVLLLNNDTMSEPDAIEKMIEAFRLDGKIILNRQDIELVLTAVPIGAEADKTDGEVTT